MINFILRDKCSPNPLSKKCLFPTYGNYYRDPQLAKGIRYLWMSNANWYIFEAIPRPKLREKIVEEVVEIF